MPSSSTIRVQVESALAHKFPSALTPPARMVRPVVSTGIDALDELVQGELPVGAVTEQAVNSHKRAAQSKVVKMMIPNLGEVKGGAHPQNAQ